MVIDFHTHIFSEWVIDNKDLCIKRDATFRELFNDPNARIVSFQELIQSMDEEDIDVSVVMGIGWNDAKLAVDSNDYLIDAVAKSNGRLVGFAGVNPAWGDDCSKEIDRCSKAGLKGIGELHPDTQGFDLTDGKIMSSFLEAVRYHDLIVTTHSSEPVGHTYGGKGKIYPSVLWEFIQNCPGIAIVCAHWGGGLPIYSLMPEVEEVLANVYFDTAASPFLYRSEIFESVVSILGAHKVLMASDYPLVKPSRILDQISGSNLEEHEKNLITGGNATRLLGL